MIQAWKFKCIVYKMVSFMSYVMYHTKLDIKGFVCLLVLPGLFMNVSLPYYTLFYNLIVTYSLAILACE